MSFIIGSPNNPIDAYIDKPKTNVILDAEWNKEFSSFTMMFNF